MCPHRLRLEKTSLADHEKAKLRAVLRGTLAMNVEERVTAKEVVDILEGRLSVKKMEGLVSQKGAEAVKRRTRLPKRFRDE